MFELKKQIGINLIHLCFSRCIVSLIRPDKGLTLDTVFYLLIKSVNSKVYRKSYHLAILLYFIPFNAFKLWCSLAHGVFQPRHETEVGFPIDEVYERSSKLTSGLHKVRLVDFGDLLRKKQHQ